MPRRRASCQSRLSCSLTRSCLRDPLANVNTKVQRVDVTTPIGEIIIRERHARGLSRAELASMAGMSASGLQRIENGTTPSVRLLIRIASALTVRPSWLLEEAGL
jgi:ribosome-binding protein aMBF1 (putative translation factor)